MQASKTRIISALFISLPILILAVSAHGHHGQHKARGRPSIRAAAAAVLAAAGIHKAHGVTTNTAPGGINKGLSTSTIMPEHGGNTQTKPPIRLVTAGPNNGRPPNGRGANTKTSTKPAPAATNNGHGTNSNTRQPIHAASPKAGMNNGHVTNTNTIHADSPMTAVNDERSTNANKIRAVAPGGNNNRHDINSKAIPSVHTTPAGINDGTGTNTHPGPADKAPTDINNEHTTDNQAMKTKVGELSLPLEFLIAHNKVRLLFGEPPFVWDVKLADYAQSHANKHTGDCKLIHSFGPYGENLFWAGQDHWTPANIVESWVSEQKYYQKHKNECEKGQMCGHYTQVVWRDSLKIGCATVKCQSGGLFALCEYDPPGNFVGESPFGTMINSLLTPVTTAITSSLSAPVPPSKTPPSVSSIESPSSLSELTSDGTTDLPPPSPSLESLLPPMPLEELIDDDLHKS